MLSHVFQSSAVEITTLILRAMVLTLVAMFPPLTTSLDYFLYACSLKLELPTQFLIAMLGTPVGPFYFNLNPLNKSLLKV